MPTRKRHGKRRGTARPHDDHGHDRGEHTLTLSQEARNTERHSFERSSRQLRYQTVSFVSGGHKDPDDPAVLRDLDELVIDSDLASKQDETSLRSKGAALEEGLGLFFIDADGDGQVNKAHPDPVIHYASDSSEDEVVFTGRSRQRQHTVIDDPVAPTSVERPPKRKQQQEDGDPPAYQGWTGVTAASAPRRVVLELGNDSADSDVVADYIANIQNSTSSSDEPGYDGKSKPTKTPLSSPEIDGDMDISDDDNDDEEVSDEDEDEVSEASILDECENEHTDGKMQWMSDEQLAHLLDESTRDIPDMSADDIDFMTAQGFTRATNTVSGGRKKKRGKKGKKKDADEPMSASKLADLFDEDPYGAFDVLDFNRASIMGKKARKKMPDFGISDSELETGLRESWEMDRRRKKVRKAEREEMRRQGLLGGKQKARDKDGVEDIRDEIRAFMISRTQTIHLPPMPKKDRKIVHEIANHLSLKSLSRGKGNNRYPILTKTRSTPTFEPDEADELDALFSHRRIARHTERVKPRGVGGNKARGGTKQATYADGDVVGASAPEIGAENRGRAMLEKMGWNMGMALGSGGNKGILQPVIHVVKTTKAGLG